MQLEAGDNLDTLIREEKHRVALEIFQDAWANACQEGIEASIVAETALLAALSELQHADGNGAVSDLIDSLPNRLECGHFDPDRTLQ